jgi:hypothetical protein
MNAPASSAAVEKSLPVESDVEAEVGKLVPKLTPQSQADAERIRASVSRLTSTSVEGLEGLTSELQELQTFLNSEVQRVQGEIATVLAGVKIIIETIAPWKGTPASLATPTTARPVRAGPAANIEAAQPRR